MRLHHAGYLLLIIISLSFNAQADSYDGPISDFHAHVKAGFDLDELLEIMDENNVDATLLMRRDTERFNTKNASLTTNEEIVEFKKENPGKIYLGTGLQFESWFNRDASIIEQTRERVKSGDFNLVGEVVLKSRFDRDHIQPSGPEFAAIMQIAAESQLPVVVHHNQATGEERQALLEVLRKYNNLTVIWAHMCGISEPEEVKKLFAEFPKLHCDLAWLPKGKRMAGKGVVDEDYYFTDPWRELIESYPDRFLVGVDLTTKKHYRKKYRKFVNRIRDALGGLSAETARKVATENFHRLLDK